MNKRVVVLCWLLLLAGCGSTATNVAGDTTVAPVVETTAPADAEAAVIPESAEQLPADQESDNTLAPETTVSPEATLVPETVVPESTIVPQTVPPASTVAPEPVGSPAEQLAALIADSDFGLDQTEEKCLADQLTRRLTEDQVQELIERSSEDLEPNDPLVDAVVVAYEEIAGCMGADRIVDVMVEPETDGEFLACFTAAFPSEQEQIDGVVALMTVELADLPEAPGRYEAILATLVAVCGEGAEAFQD